MYVCIIRKILIVCLVYFLNFSEGAAQSSMDLRLIMKSVYQNNPSLNAAREEYNQLLELYPQAIAGWRPDIDAEASLYHMDIDNSNFGTADGATTKNFTISLEQPIWRGGRTTAETEAAKRRILAGQARLRSAEQDIFYDVIQSYVLIIRDQHLYNLRKDYVDLLRQEHAAAVEKEELGLFTITDVRQASARLSRAISSLIQAKNNLAQSKHDFTEVTLLSVTDIKDFPIVTFIVPADKNALINMALESNPELIAAEYDRAATDYNLQATQSERFPQISGFASANKQFDPQPGVVDETRANTIGVRARMALYQGGALNSRIRENHHRIAYQEYQYETIAQAVKQSVLRDYDGYIAAKALTERRQEEIKATYTVLEGVREEVNFGQRPFLDILDMDEEVIESRLELVNAQTEEILAQFSMARTLGLLHSYSMRLAFDQM